MDFIDQSGAQHGVIQFAAAFAKQATDAVLLVQPFQRARKIHLGVAELRDGGPDLLESGDASLGRVLRC